LRLLGRKISERHNAGPGAEAVLVKLFGEKWAEVLFDG
jgi:hypothetical protein